MRAKSHTVEDDKKVLAFAIWQKAEILLELDGT
jgi:hypothetical protein